jgi:hypothetical protein
MRVSLRRGDDQNGGVRSTGDQAHLHLRRAITIMA